MEVGFIPIFRRTLIRNKGDREATNRGLTKCMEEGIPVGVLMQTKPKPGVEYEVLGLALVTQWEAGYFIFEGFSDAGNSNFKRMGADSAYDRARAETISGTSFNLEQITDLRIRQIAEVVQRKGQSKFRDKLIAVYGGKCQITGCDAVEALEAAHISSYMGELTNHVQNGLLLRADLHSLFDIGLLSIDPANMQIVLSGKLLGTQYGEFSGHKIRLPINPDFAPSQDALRHHLSWSNLTTML